jgi:dipeptidyl aminopeptidase
MHTPQHNPSGYDNASISEMPALQHTVRFLVIHGVADDNVHFQNSLALIDKLDLAGVENYDVHVYPDSDHSIYFHNAHRMVYDLKYYNIEIYSRKSMLIWSGLSYLLINAFNGEWHRTSNPSPDSVSRRLLKRFASIF